MGQAEDFFKNFLKDFYSFPEGGGGRKRERNINAWPPPMCPLLGTWPETQACALTGNGTYLTETERICQD